MAENGALGIEVFQQWRPHFIWMDLGLPQLSGMEATRRIRQLDGGAEVKIAAITAYAYASERDGVMRAGFDDLTFKPFRQKDIFLCMARHLGVRYSSSEGAGNKLHRQAGARPAWRLRSCVFPRSSLSTKLTLPRRIRRPARGYEYISFPPRPSPRYRSPTNPPAPFAISP